MAKWNRSLKVVLIEDNPDHVQLIQDCFDMAEIPREINVFESGSEALKFLNEFGSLGPAQANPFFPDVIFLDLMLPGEHGFDILQTLQDHDKLKNIPVVVMTSANTPRDRALTYRLGATVFLQKPCTETVLKGLIRQLKITNRIQI